MSTAFGVNRDTKGNGTSPLDIRMILDALFATAGIVKGLEVSGGPGLAYTVAAGVAVCQKAPGDGKTLAPWAGGVTPQVQTGDPSNPRIDSVWIIAHDLETGDSDNLVTVGVTQGQPAATPLAPEVPAGSLELGRLLMPAGATSAASATMQHRALPSLFYSSPSGLLAESWQKYDYESKWMKDGDMGGQRLAFDLSTPRTIGFDFYCNFSIPGAKAGTSESCNVWFMVDGKPLDHSGVLMVNQGDAWTSHETHFTATIPAGRHTASVHWPARSKRDIAFHYAGNDENGGTFVGRRFQIWDKGVAL